MAQGRVWTGRQALQIGLVDQIGGLETALQIAADRAAFPLKSLKIDIGGRRLSVQTMQDPGSGFPFPFGSWAMIDSILWGLGPFRGSSKPDHTTDNEVGKVLCDETLASTGLVSADSLGIGSVVQSMGLSGGVGYAVAHSAVGGLMTQLMGYVSSKGFVSPRE